MLGNGECSILDIRIKTMEKKVKVLLSAYNGEKYIVEQVESILNQTYQNIELYIRDDGSKDNTLKVLKPYQDNPKVHIIQGENVGFIKSFLQLVELSGEADFYSYADQDDVWFSDKVERAVSKMTKAERKKDDVPILYFTNYDFYDGNMNFQSHGMAPTLKPSFHNALVDCMPLGFNTMFNKKAHDMICADMPKHSCGHDWWTYMVCAGMGEVIYDDKPTVCYRRHEKNVSAGGMNFIKFQIWRFKKFFANHYFRNIRMQLREYQRIYGEQLAPKDQILLDWFCDEQYNFVHAIKKAFYGKRFRSRMVDEIMVRVIFLIGQL